ncbi:unnamed protein product [Rotaria sordida]|uniref:Uncharacterized protein n=1 Tax=Rotaria sordida TaxID=392033 RepID=A0A813XAJ5_9BILA|nr:unnamed protein product [Rotaria sordida]CAF1396221.1 unnamed protein product [Rotaria sordida]
MNISFQQITKSRDYILSIGFPRSFLFFMIRINRSRDPVAYLRYIIDHYSNLPSSIAFVHGHRTSWHQRDPSDIVTALRALQCHKYNYMPLTNKKTEHEFKQNSRNRQDRVNYNLWKAVLQKELRPAPANGIRTHCYVTFAIKREAFLTHPTIVYSNILDYLLTTSYSDYYTSRTLEYA